MIRLLPAAGHRLMPWKNGGGVTTEIIVEPRGAGLDTFDWRISMADVASDGAFSPFPGVDRTLAVLSGEGLRLDIEGREPLDISPVAAPVAFPADVLTHAVLKGGAIRDLNVMSRRAVFSHKVSRYRGSEAVTVTPGLGHTLVLSRMNRLAVACHGNGASGLLDMDDAAFLDATATFTPLESGEFFIIEIVPVAEADAP